MLTLFYRQMPALVEHGYVYIAQPPLYKVKQGRDERYLQDDQEEAQYMMEVALKDAGVIPAEGAEPLRGDTLNELVRQYILADSVINRLGRSMDVEALSAMAEGVSLSLDDQALAEASAQRLQAAIENPALPGNVSVVAEQPEEDGPWRLVLRRMHHGNVRVSVFDRTFVRGADYAVLAKAAKTFVDLMGKGALVFRGEGDKRKEKYVSDFREAVHWLRKEAERSVSKQRYKGLGEMNPQQLWETTMDPKVRRLWRVQIDDAIVADEVFTTLMGDHVEPRREFIEAHALQAGNIDT